MPSICYYPARTFLSLYNFYEFLRQTILHFIAYIIYVNFLFEIPIHFQVFTIILLIVLHPFRKDAPPYTLSKRTIIICIDLNHNFDNNTYQFEIQPLILNIYMFVACIFQIEPIIIPTGLIMLFVFHFIFNRRLESLRDGI